MFNLPEPLHPAVVHFPIVLLLLGAAVACVAVFLNRWHLPWIAAGLLVLGAVGVFVAVETGEKDEEMVEGMPPAAENLLDQHEEWAERTQIVAGIAAVLAIVAAGLGAATGIRTSRPSAHLAADGEPAHTRRRSVGLPMLATGARAVTALVALVAGFFIYQTAHRGGELVYNHGAGVMVSPTAKQSAKIPVAREDDDD